MSQADDDIIAVGDSFARIEGVTALERFNVLVRWHGGRTSSVDLAPNIGTFKHYAPLRSDRALFESVHVANPSTIAWGADDAIDMHVAELERLAGEAMGPADFKEWMERLHLTRDAAAALLGISRRTVGHYLGGQPIPRYMALACARLASIHGLGRDTAGSAR